MESGSRRRIQEPQEERTIYSWALFKKTRAPSLVMSGMMFAFKKHCYAGRQLDGDDLK